MSSKNSRSEAEQEKAVWSDNIMNEDMQKWAAWVQILISLDNLGVLVTKWNTKPILFP